jgi:Prokaryotic phospholipase A2
MRVHLAVLVAVTSLLTVLSPAPTGSASESTATSPPEAVHSATSDLAEVKRIMYTLTLDEFVAAADAGASVIDSWFDWTTDWCSAPLVGSTGRSFDFSQPCRRHDFGYRNLQLIEQRYGDGDRYWNATSRKRVDRRLLADMKSHCRNRAWYDAPTCRAWATTFYSAVRVHGGP